MNDEELMKRVLANQIKEIISQLLESRKRDEVEEFKNQILARNERILKRIGDEMNIESRYDPKEMETVYAVIFRIKDSEKHLWAH